VNNITAGVKVRHKVAPLSTLTLTYLRRRGRLSHFRECHRVTVALATAVLYATLHLYGIRQNLTLRNFVFLNSGYIWNKNKTKQFLFQFYFRRGYMWNNTETKHWNILQKIFSELENLKSNDAIVKMMNCLVWKWRRLYLTRLAKISGKFLS